MTEIFQLDSRLAGDGVKLLDLKLNRVLLVDNALFPWVILVPRRENIREIIDLNRDDRITLLDEISLISEVMMAQFSPDKLNVAALGNIVPQLHIHVIARYKHDLAWPSPVFGKDKKPYEREQYKIILKQLKGAITSKAITY